MSEIRVPVSVGELVDKITILRIKNRNIEDPAKKYNINLELSLLVKICQDTGIDLDEPLVAELEKINAQLWLIEDQIREKERAKEFDQNFIKLARDVYRTNDRRFFVKRKINEAFGSMLVEEKSYQEY